MLQQEAMTRENFERQEKGLPILKPEKEIPPEPKKPVVEHEVKMSDIPEGYDVKLEYAKRTGVRNEEGILFIGYDVEIELIPTVKKKGPGRPKESKDEQLKPLSLKGWMIEGEFLTFVRTFRKQIDQQVIHG